MKVQSTLVCLKGALALALAVALGNVSTARGQSITGSGLLSGTPDGSGGYNYTITLQNSSSSTAPIGTFWYAWTPGYFFLNSIPSNIAAPAGWSGMEQDDGYYGSILFTANTAGTVIQPGSALNFSFSSSDSPDTMNGGAWDGYDQVGTSFLYSGNNVSGTASEFNVTAAPVPEPTSISLLALGALGGVCGGWRKLRGR